MSVFFCSVLLSALASVSAQEISETEPLFSPSVARRFYEVALELAQSGQAKETDLKQAMVFLSAGAQLDKRADYLLAEMIDIASEQPALKDSQRLKDLLEAYVNKTADLEVVRKGVRALLEQLDSREQREELLRELLGDLGGRNPWLESELDTLLGLLMVEKADTESAKTYLMEAYDKNKYNTLAFAKLAELAPEQINPAAYLEHLRFAIDKNPFDIDAALAFAEYAKKLELYDSAAKAYKYCADLYAYLRPSAPLPAQIYRPWMLCCYNDERNLAKCLQIAYQLRQGGQFDLVAEAIAGKAAAKMGHSDQSKHILKAAEEEALKLIEDSSSRKVGLDELAWFYCFAVADLNEAVRWANKAYSQEPTSPTSAGILAYSLAMNGQADWAKSLIEKGWPNQLADLAMAQIQLSKGQKSEAIETLQQAIAKDPASLAAERAKELLIQNGGSYISAVDANAALAKVKGSFGEAIAPTFLKPQELVSVELKLRGSTFSYGQEFDASLAITNNSALPLVIGNEGLFEGNIRVDADLSGDINRKIANLVNIKICPSLPVKPGESILVPLPLVAGELKHILFTHPQASLELKFTAYIDPVMTDAGTVKNGLNIKPVTAVVERPGVKLTGRYLQNQFNSLKRGREGQKIKAGQLFASLLAEEHAMANREPLYRFVYADWMPAMLKSALVHNLTDKSWTVRVHTMVSVLPLPLDYELIDAVAENLNDSRWAVRMTALYVLAKSEQKNFDKVLDWAAQYDNNEFVREMAVALGGASAKDVQTPSNTRQQEQKSR